MVGQRTRCRDQVLPQFDHLDAWDFVIGDVLDDALDSLVYSVDRARHLLEFLLLDRRSFWWHHQDSSW